MHRSDPLPVARALIGERFPQARAAWLDGSVAGGEMTATSDVDIVVLLPGPPAPLRESLSYQGWPVELFAHTESSLGHYCDLDLARRQPTMMRLVGESIVLLDGDGLGTRLQAQCRAQVAAGPGPVEPETLAAMRYAVTGLLDDLLAAGQDGEGAAIACRLYEDAAGLLLAGAARWTGTGKGLHREVCDLDRAAGTGYAERLSSGLRAAVSGGVTSLAAAAEAILDEHGGRLFAGYRSVGVDPLRPDVGADGAADPWTQAGFGVRFERGATGAARLADPAGCLVVVDVLSFTTSVDILVGRGTRVYPYRWADDRAVEFAATVDAELAVRRREVSPERPWSLSPAALRDAPSVDALVLPSPNGSTIATAGSGARVAACLRNTAAVTGWLLRQGFGTAERPVTVIAAGERWPDGSLRPALEDDLGAGAVLAGLAATGCALSPEARVAAAAFRGVDDVGAAVRDCASARELVAAGYPVDVDLAVELDVSTAVPVLSDGSFVDDRR